MSCAKRPAAPHRGLAAATIAGRLAYWPLVRDAECRHALPAGLLDALVMQESRYRPSEVSAAGAGGLTQLMPQTANDLGVIDRFDPAANIEGGARYLRSMIDRYQSVPLALAAYNAGRGAVDRWRGIPLNHETPSYVEKILGYFNEVTPAPQLNLPALVSHAVSMSFELHTQY
ncbi:MULTISPECIES: lytic transglycosylase domain-containing protein [Sphingosinicellaceae]|uniref:lytic transglycosylase domain-containing protein n=1 Tax=Sphingosinicellaceae TaxID=2820280 RepID=UPI001D016E65|nr:MULTISPECIES: lytic transglycosylase domain-containing protein [Polymorphobacter]